MPGFPWVAVAGAALGIGSSFLGAGSAEKARKARNEAKKKQYHRSVDAAVTGVKYQDEMNLLDWAWKTAETEAIRYQEDQAELDYNFRQGRLTEAALENLRINEGAIFDQFVIGEDLRAKQDMMSLGFNADQLGIQADQVALEANNAARGYMNAVKDNSLQAQQYALSQNRQLETLVRNQVLDAQLETLERDTQFAVSLAEQGQRRASALSRGASAATAKALQQNTAKALGRSYGQLKIRQQQRRNSLATTNAVMQGETSKGLARFALSSAQAMQDTKAVQKNLNLQLRDIQQKGQYEFNQFDKLTIPGYQLAANQGQRELDALFLRTQGQLDDASMPYRKSIIFDPQKPLPGLYPVMAQPTYERKQSTGAIIGNALTAGITGAMQGAYTTGSGGLAFR